MARKGMHTNVNKNDSKIHMMWRWHKSLYHRSERKYPLSAEDETSGILQTFIRQIENQLSHRVKIIRSDNGTEFKNRDMLEFCGNKGIKQEYSNDRTPQQNEVAKRMNRTLIEVARTMLADSLLPTTFWAEAVSTACYIFNRNSNSYLRDILGDILGKDMSKDEAPDFIMKFLKMIQLRLKAPVRRIRTDNGTKFVNQTLRGYYKKVSISHETSVARSPQQNGVIERRNCTLIEAACTISLEPVLHEMTLATISSGLVPTPPPSTSFVPPSRTDWDILFQPLFDELLNPQSSVDHPTPKFIAPIAEVVALEPVVSTDSPSSTIVDQDAPSPSTSKTTPETQSLVISNDVEEENHNLIVAHMNNDPFFCILIPENNTKASSSSDVIPTIVHTAAPNSEHITK
ncbi:integrase, catalytic region, zinc finger, CCHC-type containing protein [Tanacetum coccineum]